MKKNQLELESKSIFQKKYRNVGKTVFYLNLANLFGTSRIIFLYGKYSFLGKANLAYTVSMYFNKKFLL